MMSVSGKTGDGLVVKRKKEEQDELLKLLHDLLYDLQHILPEELKQNNFSPLLHQMEQVCLILTHHYVYFYSFLTILCSYVLQDYQRRRIYLSFLCTEKLEMLQV